jgi:hypothetical protein
MQKCRKAVIDLGAFSLEDGTGNPFQDYTNLFVEKRSPEHIFSRYFIKSNGWDSADNNTHSPLFNGPNGYSAWAGNTPIQALVDDYEMTDGTRSISWTILHIKQLHMKIEIRVFMHLSFMMAPLGDKDHQVPASYDPDNTE